MEEQGALAESAWRRRQRAHERRVDVWIDPHLARRRRSEAHPVEDFLFTYYSQRPAQLRRWHPGDRALLLGARAEELGRDHVDVPGGARLDVLAAVTRHERTLHWVRDLLRATSERPPTLGCFGLHEWAMVYRQAPGDLRHSSYSLRLGPSGTDALVDALQLRCTHADAFRFFTTPARPLNSEQVPRARQLELEQPGCLHAGMDLYKWAYKLGALVPSELVADCFALARDIRLLDMRASPYDLAALEVEPLKIETPQGRSEYAERQRAFAEQARPLRAQLVAVCERWIAHLPERGEAAPG